MTPIKPIKIPNNLVVLNLSSIVKKCESIKANNGAVDNNNPAKDELIYISDQDIKIKGIKFPSKAVKKI